MFLCKGRKENINKEIKNIAFKWNKLLLYLSSAGTGVIVWLDFLSCPSSDIEIPGSSNAASPPAEPAN